MSTLVLAGTCAWLLMRLHTEYERAAVESSERAKERGKVATLEHERDELEREVRRLRREASAASEGEVLAVASASNPRTPVAASAPVPGSARYEAIPGGLRTMGVMRTYSDLVREMRLSSSETKQFLELLARFEQTPFGPDMDEPPDPATLRHRLHELEQKRDAEIAELLGPERTSQFKAYRDSGPQRAELRLIAEQLDLLGTPLDREQRNKLLAILQEEGRRSAAPVLNPEGNGRELERYRQWQMDTQRRIHERATQVLDPEQAAHLNEYYAMHAAPGAGSKIIGARLTETPASPSP